MRFKIDPNKHWQFYLTRPFDLFTTTLWQGWYESKYMQDALGFKMDEVLCVEISPHLVSQYRTRKQLKQLSDNLHKLLKNHEKFEKLLKHGLDLSKNADQHLKKSHGGFTGLDDALDFFNELIFYTTVLPYFPRFLSKNQILPVKIEKLLEQLRKTSYYLPFMKRVILPLVKDHPLMAIQKKNSDKRFIYLKLKGKETIEWVSNPRKILKQLEGSEFNSKEIKGQSAYPGKVKGRVHLVLDFTKPGKMKNNQVLVSINTNPSLVPLIKKASAIVSDEGGITSHAAIVSREFKIPCIIGTKFATKILKEGDIVEVDANKGIVRKI